MANPSLNDHKEDVAPSSDALSPLLTLSVFDIDDVADYFVVFSVFLFIKVVPAVLLPIKELVAFSLLQRYVQVV